MLQNSIFAVILSKLPPNVESFLSFAQGIGEVLSANFCSIKDHQSLHLLMGTQDNPTSVFLLIYLTTCGQLQESVQ